MTNTDLTEEQQRAQDHPPAWSEVFGEEDPGYAFQDQPPINQSAKAHAQRRRAKDQEARHEQNMQQLVAAARLEDDQAAHEQVMRLISKGQDIPPVLAEQAMRYQRQQGELRMSSAQLIAARARRGRG
jgi:hypothetical protein